MNFTVIKTKNLQNLSLTNQKQPLTRYWQKRGRSTSLNICNSIKVWCITQADIFQMPLLRQYQNRCGEIRSAPFATTVRRITSASCARRFADFAQQADLLNPKNGSKLPSRDFANPPNRWQQVY